VELEKSQVTKDYDVLLAERENLEVPAEPRGGKGAHGDKGHRPLKRVF